MALGARPSSVRALVLKQSLAVVAPGMAIGVMAALAATRLLGSWLYGVGATDFWTFVTAGSVLGAAALAASWIPARRAARVSPMAALRSERCHAPGPFRAEDARSGNWVLGGIARRRTLL